MHCHLKDCLIDFGPSPSFWLFPFERMNGFLGRFHKHCKLLPAVKQKAFNPKDLQQINSCLSSILREKYKLTFLLHQESKSVVFNNDRMDVSHLVKKKVHLLLSRTRPIHKKEFNFHVF